MAHGRIATKLAQDGLQVSVHAGCAQGQGQRSRDMRTFLDSWNELLRHLRSGLISYAFLVLEVLIIFVFSYRKLSTLFIENTGK